VPKCWLINVDIVREAHYVRLAGHIVVTEGCIKAVLRLIAEKMKVPFRIIFLETPKTAE
jgi:hypothetical protein